MKVRNIGFVVLALWPVSAYAITTFVDRGTAGSFAVLAGSTVTNTGMTNVFGDLGVWPGTANYRLSSRDRERWYDIRWGCHCNAGAERPEYGI
jgi:hypothetical protein